MRRRSIFRRPAFTGIGRIHRAALRCRDGGPAHVFKLCEGKPTDAGAVEQAETALRGCPEFGW
jgi:hypothetical protein